MLRTVVGASVAGRVLTGSETGNLLAVRSHLSSEFLAMRPFTG